MVPLETLPLFMFCAFFLCLILYGQGDGAVWFSGGRSVAEFEIFFMQQRDAMGPPTFLAQRDSGRAGEADGASNLVEVDVEPTTPRMPSTAGVVGRRVAKDEVTGGDDDDSDGDSDSALAARVDALTKRVEQLEKKLRKLGSLWAQDE